MSARKKARRSSNRSKSRRPAQNPKTTASPGEQKQFLEHYNACDFGAAQKYAETLTRRYPKDAFGWKVLGSCLHKNGQIAQSQDTLARSLRLNAADAQAQHLMARAWYDLGEPAQALDYAREAVRLEPEFAQGHFTLAEILSESDKDDDALTHALRAQALGHGENACLLMLGHIHAKRRRYQQAVGAIQKLVERDPGNAFAQNEIANLYKDLGQFEQAKAAYRKALSLEPGFDSAFSNLLICMHYDPAVSAEQIFETVQQWEHHFPNRLAQYQHRVDSADADKIIRIGMVSPGFRMHPVGQMILTGLEQLEPGFEIHAYSTNNAEDALTRRLKQVATSWNLVRHLDQDALADRIYNDGIDILIDLSGYGEGSRLRTISRKPAPLIVKWVGGLINTMGLSAFDYLISDHNETPEDVDDWYTEKLIRLPNDYICYLPAPDAPPITALPAISNGHITLGCFNNPAKINPVLLAEWAKLMHELPDSRLLLKSGQYDSPEYCERIRSIMAEHGVTAGRLLLEGPAKHRELLEAYNRVDIALDTWPYSGGLTTCEAFMMGVPVVTLPGPTFAGRHSATHLINAGMPELVTKSWDHYRQKAVELASDIPNLSVIRACLRQFLVQSPVCDAQKFGGYLSAAIRAIWQRYCDSLPAAKLGFEHGGAVIFKDDDQPWVIPKTIDIEPSKARKVFVIGFPKSGTTTIQQALKASGIATAHWRIEDGFCGELIYKGYWEQNDPLYYFNDYDGVTQADVCLPEKNINYWPNLDFQIISRIEALYPNCLFVLNYRDPKKIASSIMAWGDLHDRMMASTIPGLGKSADTKQNLLDWIESHYATCRMHFKHSSRFLELDIESLEAPQKLAERLGADIKWWGVANPNREQPTATGVIDIPGRPHMSDKELELFEHYLSNASSYFEFGTGGSTALAIEHGLTVYGVDSDKQWADALRSKFGASCKIRWCDIGATRDWGFPADTAMKDAYPSFSQTIFDESRQYDLVLIDGRFRTACVLMAIKKALAEPSCSMTVFIHDFWNRSQYHVVLLFLDHVASAETAGVFKPRENIDINLLEKMYEIYAYNPN